MCEDDYNPYYDYELGTPLEMAMDREDYDTVYSILAEDGIFPDDENDEDEIE